MKRFLFIFVGLCLLAPLHSFAQPDTLFHENFDLPSGADKVTTLGKGGAQRVWSDTNNLSVSGNQSYHGRVGNAIFKEVIFRTDTFSTKGKGYRFVKMSWDHIAKLNVINRGLIRVSTDAGRTWTQVDSTNSDYLGGSFNYSQLGWFNESSYTASGLQTDIWKSGIDTPATNQWWKSEELVITDLALGNQKQGYDSVLVEFSCQFVANFPSGAPGEGWYVDNLLVEGDSCEVYPPHIRARKRFGANNKCAANPQGAFGYVSGHIYETRIEVNDSVQNQTFNDPRYSGIDSVFVFYRVTDTNGTTGAWKKGKMNSTFSDFYKGGFVGLNLGDTVEYYYTARDKGCRSSRLPAKPNEYYRFYLAKNISSKCGNVQCKKLPRLIDRLPWVVDFEKPKWQAGVGAGNTGAVHRGDFPTDQLSREQQWEVSPAENQSGYAWSIRSGPTNSRGTGPIRDHTPGNGNQYLYTEASQGTQFSTTQLITPCIQVPDTSATLFLEFYYHFFGANMGRLRLDIDIGKDTSNYWIGYDRINGQTHSSSQSLWKRIIINLAPFKGKTIKIRFHSRKDFPAGNDKGDMALDDLRIFAPGGNDVFVRNLVSPVGGACGYPALEDAIVQIQNTGSDTLRSVPMILRVKGPGGTNTKTETANLNLPPGDTANYKLSNQISFASNGTYEITVKSVLQGDIDRSNDSTSRIISNNPTIQNFPYIQDFESAGASQSSNFQTGLFQPLALPDSSYRWIIGEGLTPTLNTGPISGYPDSGKYAYARAFKSQSDSTVLETNQCIDLHKLSKPVLSFYYHMYGSDIQSLEVKAKDSTGWHSVAASTLNQGFQTGIKESWKVHSVPLDAYKNSFIKLRIIARKNSGGTSSDIAIDKIMIFDRALKDVGFVDIQKPSRGIRSGVSLANVGLDYTVYNFGTSPIAVHPEVSVTPLCDTGKGVTKFYRYPNRININPLEEKAAKNVRLQFQLEPGACRVCLYGDGLSAIDTNNFNDTVCKIIVGRPEIEAPFKANFDTCAYDRAGFFSVGKYRSWVRATPSGNRINSPQSSPRVWVIVDTGAYLPGSDEILKVPFLSGFDSLRGVEVRMWQNIEMGGGYGALQYKDGPKFTSIGKSDLNARNWYRSFFGVIGATSLPDNAAFTGSSLGWKYSSARLGANFYTQGAKALQFHFVSNNMPNTSNLEGWAIDDLEFYVPSQNSASPASLQWKAGRAFPGKNPAEINLQNTGARNLKETVLTIVANGNITLTDTLQFPQTGIAPQASKTISLADSIPLQPGSNSLTIITSLPNGAADDKPVDDTLSIIVESRRPSDSTVCQDFEKARFLSPGSFALRGKGLWEYGAPNKATIPGAFSGNKAWITDTLNPYPILRKGKLYTPSFVVEKGKCYRFSFRHNYNTELHFDGGNVEVRKNNSSNWSLLGNAGRSAGNWYNTGAVQALKQSRAGWSGNSGGWVHSFIDFTASEDDTLAFRFNFASNGSINGDGWAIDDFCFTHLVSCDSSTSLEETMLRGLEVYPNPTHGMVTVQLTTQQQNAMIKVHDARGKLVKQLVASQSREKLDLSGLPAGVYMLRVVANGKVATRKIVRQ